MTETARQTTGEIAVLDRTAWSESKQTADRYLVGVGVSLPDVRAELIEAAADRLEIDNRSAAPRVRGVRILASVERVLCERLGARPGSDTSNSDTARRRLLFAVNPTVEAQRALQRRRGPAGRAAMAESLLRIPEVRCRKRMRRQEIAFRHLPLHGLRLARGASR